MWTGLKLVSKRYLPIGLAPFPCQPAGCITGDALDS
jgi:hypothetical protein